MTLQSGVQPNGSFAWGLHQPSYRVRNQRQRDQVMVLGATADESPLDVDNRANFPTDDVPVEGADGVYEIPNALPFRGVTYIGQRWADGRASHPAGIGLPPREPCRFLEEMAALVADGQGPEAMVAALPQPLKLALATTSTAPEDLVALAASCADFVWGPDTDPAPVPVGLVYARDTRGRLRPVIHDDQLFDAVANNACLPYAFKEAMVLRPGVQGNSEIVGDWHAGDGATTHIYEYLRTNSYIPWGHYAANMAHDCVRYDAGGLNSADMAGLRGLYYQRTFLRLAEQLSLPRPPARRQLNPKELETLRLAIRERLGEEGAPRLTFNASLWGWNYGYDFAPTRYRLHASHQQIHQQFALVPRRVNAPASGSKQISCYACGDLIADLCESYRRRNGVAFFEAYLKAIRTNTRMDDRRDREASLVVHEADGVMVFVPKAQTSQWELQIMPTTAVGNILEADSDLRGALDRALHKAMGVLSGLGARMVTVIEYNKRFDARHQDQHLLYALLPRLPESPGAFSEAQLRWINGHYPEDFAAACRKQLANLADEGA